MSSKRGETGYQLALYFAMTLEKKKGKQCNPMYMPQREELSTVIPALVCILRFYKRYASGGLSWSDSVSVDWPESDFVSVGPAFLVTLSGIGCCGAWE